MWWFIQAAMFDLDLVWFGGGWDWRKAKYSLSHSTPLFFFFFFFFFLLSLTPLVQISFFSQPSATFKIKVGGHNFCQENTEYLLAKIMTTLQARYQTSSSVVHIYRILHVANGNKFYLWVLIISFTWVWKTPKNARK